MLDRGNETGGRSGGSIGYGAEVLGFTESAFTLLRDLIAQHTGVHFDHGKRDLLADKLIELVAGQGMTSFLDYYYLLRYDEHADRHWSALMDRLAVPETFFWRQPEQIVAVARTLVPRLRAARPAHPERPLRIWSAACCSGEEPLSIAIALAEEGLLDGAPIEIVASDGSAAMIERARRGVYGERSFRNLPAHLRSRYFERDGQGWRVDPKLHERVRWSVANLVDPDAVRPLAASDVIFCRNVFIYFADETVARVARSFGEAMREPGYLFLGAAESLTRLATPFELAEMDGAFVYVKRAPVRTQTPAAR